MPHTKYTICDVFSAFDGPFFPHSSADGFSFAVLPSSPRLLSMPFFIFWLKSYYFRRKRMDSFSYLFLSGLVMLVPPFFK